VVAAFWLKSKLPFLHDAVICESDRRRYGIDDKVRWDRIGMPLIRQNTSLQNNLTIKDKQLEEAAQVKNVLLGQISTLQEELKVSEEKLNEVNRLTGQITTLKEALKFSEEKLNEVREVNAKLMVEKDADKKELQNKTLILNQVLCKFKLKRRGIFKITKCIDFVNRANEGLVTIESLAESLNVDLGGFESL